MEEENSADNSTDQILTTRSNNAVGTTAKPKAMLAGLKRRRKGRTLKKSSLVPKQFELLECLKWADDRVRAECSGECEIADRLPMVGGGMPRMQQ